MSTTTKLTNWKECLLSQLFILRFSKKTIEILDTISETLPSPETEDQHEFITLLLSNALEQGLITEQESFKIKQEFWEIYPFSE